MNLVESTIRVPVKHLIDSFFVVLPRQSYPKYDILYIHPNNVEIHLALAGFEKHEITVQMSGSQITLTGQKHSANTWQYLHKSISTRGFIMCFHVKDAVKIHNVRFINGLLMISMLAQISPNVTYLQIQ